jgi:hypothetical protein
VLTAENVASGQKSFSEAMRGWERSPEHKRNLLLPDAESVGVAMSYRNGRAYYTLVLGAESRGVIHPSGSRPQGGGDARAICAAATPCY